MGKKEEISNRLAAFLSRSSLDPCPHLLGGGILRRSCWLVFGLTCNAILVAAIVYLLEEFKDSPTKMSSTIGE